jgi:hypothetical protein
LIPEHYQFEDITGAKPIIHAYDFDYGSPLSFMAGSDDLLLKDENRQILDRPMSLLQATVVGLSDPLIFEPVVVESFSSDEKTTLVSGYKHASPPTFPGIMTILEKENASLDQFLVTELSFDHEK